MHTPAWKRPAHSVAGSWPIVVGGGVVPFGSPRAVPHVKPFCVNTTPTRVHGNTRLNAAACSSCRHVHARPSGNGNDLGPFAGVFGPLHAGGMFGWVCHVIAAMTAHHRAVVKNRALRV